MSKAGDFEINVGEPYPIRCKMFYKNMPIVTFSHSELSDLKYAIEKAMQEAICKLPPNDRHEIRLVND